MLEVITIYPGDPSDEYRRRRGLEWIRPVL